MGTAKTKAQNKWVSKTYDRVALLVPKGKKDLIKAYAEGQGQSLNAYINDLIDKDMSHPKS